MTQTLVWRANLASHTTLNSGAPSNFTAVDGTGYSRKVGPVYDSEVSPGWSLRVPYRQDVSGTPGTILDAYYDFTASPITTGMMCGWYRFAGASTSYCRTLLARGYVSDVTLPLFSIVVKRVATGAAPLTLAVEDFVNNVTSPVAGVLDANRWVFLQIAWHYTGTKTTFRGYYSLDGVTMNLIGSFIFTSATNLTPRRVFCRAVYNELSAVDPWYGAAGGLSLYSTGSLTEGSIYPTDIAPPVDTPSTWCVDSVSGSDSNNGYGSSQAWLTASNLRTELKRQTIMGNWRPWRDENGNDAGISTIATKNHALAWRDAYKLGERTAWGDIIEIRGGSLYLDDKLALETLPGVTVRAAASGSATIMRDIGSTFTQPNSGTAPNVWQILGATYGGVTVAGVGSGCGVVGYEGTKLMTPLAGANLAAVLSTLNSTAGSCYADSSGFYFRPFTGNAPNTDGVTRKVSTVMTASGTGAGVVALGDGLIQDITIEAGPVCQYTSSAAAFPQYVASSTTGVLCVRDGCTFSQGTYHSTGMVGAGLTGMQFEYQCTHQRMWSQTGAITTVAYTSETSTSGRLISIFDQVTESSIQASGAEASSTLAHDSFYTHSNGGRTLPAFSTEITDSTFCGDLNEQLHQPNEFKVEDTTFTYLVGGSTGTLANRCKLLAPTSTAFAGDTTIRNSIITSGVAYNQSPLSLNTALIYDRSTLDLSTFAGTALTTDNGAAASFTLTSCAVICNGSSAPLITSAEGSGDTINIVNTAFLGSTTPTVLISYNDGSTTANRTYAQCVTLGLITGSVASASNGLDSSSDYAVAAGSPVIGAGISGTDVEDYTGVEFATRNDAGAREYVVEPVEPAVISQLTTSLEYTAPLRNLDFTPQLR